MNGRSRGIGEMKERGRGVSAPGGTNRLATRTDTGERRATECLDKRRRDKGGATGERDSGRGGHRRGGSRVDGLGPGQNGVRTTHGRSRGAKRVVDRGTLLFGGRWERKEREFGCGIDLKDNG